MSCHRSRITFPHFFHRLVSFPKTCSSPRQRQALSKPGELLKLPSRSSEMPSFQMLYRCFKAQRRRATPRKQSMSQRSRPKTPFLQPLKSTWTNILKTKSSGSEMYWTKSAKHGMQRCVRLLKLVPAPPTHLPCVTTLRSRLDGPQYPIPTKPEQHPRNPDVPLILQSRPSQTQRSRRVP